MQRYANGCAQWCKLVLHVMVNLETVLKIDNLPNLSKVFFQLFLGGIKLDITDCVSFHPSRAHKDQPHCQQK